MLCDTHIAAGASTALLLVQPQGVLPAAGVVLAALCGSVISDIDSDRSWSRKQADILLGVSASGFEGAALIAVVTGQAGFMVDTIGAAVGLGKLASCVLAAILCIFGMGQGHRSFMHSIMAGAALTACVYAALARQQACAFLAGFLSHWTCQTIRGCSCSGRPRSACASIYACRMGLSTGCLAKRSWSPPSCCSTPAQGLACAATSRAW